MDALVLKDIAPYTVAIFGAIFMLTYKTDSMRLKQNFSKLGEVKGGNKTDILTALGMPSNISEIGNGRSLFQWTTPKYSVCLIFENELCVEITHKPNV